MPNVFRPLWLSIACSLPALALADDYSQLPPPTLSSDENDSYTLYLILSVNGTPSPGLVPVQVKHGHYWIDALPLLKAHLRLEQTSGLTDVSVLPQVQTRYDSARQVLNLQVPDQWLPEQHLDSGFSKNSLRPVSSSGLLFNYDSYSLRSPYGGTSASTLLEGRWFGNAGTVSQTGVWRNQFAGERGTPSGYVRYDTVWKYSDPSKLISIQAGDFVSDSVTWSHSVRMGGIRISRNFTVRPDLVTYPLLNWSGVAAVPGTVDLFVNGYKASSQSVNSGPYSLTNVPYINGAGEATVVTTDALGRQVSTSIPFYVSNKLLAKGLSDFDFSAGSLRRNYGIDNADYGNAAVSGIYRYGLSNQLTGTVHSEVSNGLMLAGLGADFTPGRLGTVSLSASTGQDNRHNRGYQYTSGWSYYSKYWSLSLQHISVSGDYQDLSTLETRTTLSRRADQATVSIIPSGKVFGTFGLGYFSVQANDGTRTRLANFSWSHSLGGNSSLSLSLNRDLGSHSVTGVAQITIPWGDQSVVNSSSSLAANGQITNRLEYTRTAPVDGGLGWTVAHSINGDSYNQLNLTWLNRYSSLSGGFYGTRGQSNQWFEASGSVVVMDNDLFFSRRINDAFIVADTDGYPKASIRYENRHVGDTDSNGHLLIPWVSAWYPGKVSINTMDFPTDTDVPVSEQKVAVREGSGAVVHFSVEKVRSAVLTVTDQHHHPLPVSTPVDEINSEQTGVIGYDGQAWLSHLGRHNRLEIMTANGTCHFTFDLPAVTTVPAIIGPIICPSAPATEALHEN